MKRKLTIIFALTFMLVLALAFSASSAFAEEYGYTISVYPGADGIGTYQGSSKVVTKKVKAGETVRIDLSDVEVKDSRYYARGFRVAGHDADEMELKTTTTGFTNMTFQASEDVDYVVAYGIKGSMVSYTVRYLDDETGRALMKDDVYLGMPGDKPAVSFRYIEGYQPKTYNLGKELTDNDEENIFEFRYVAGGNTETETVTETNTTVRTVNGAAAPGTAANPAGTNAGAPAAAAAGGNADNGGTTIGDNATPQAQGPSQYTDLDNNETPKADGSSAGAGKTPIFIGCAAGILILLALLLYLLRKRNQEEEEVEEE